MREPIWRSPFFWAAVIALAAIPLLRPFLRFEPDPPPVLAELPEYTLLDTAGAPFGSAQLAGQVYVADFIFTRCFSICPNLTAAMKQLDRRYQEAGVEGIHLVSISVDPEYDTPEVLTAYATDHQIDTERWSLLTGEEERIRELLVQGFRTGMGEAMPAGEGLIDISHSGKLVLVDRDGSVRGYYDHDEMGIDELFHRSQHVLHERR